MGRAIISATFKKFSQDIENLWKNFEDKIDYLKNRTKDEMEVLYIAKDYYMDDSKKYFYKIDKPRRQLTPVNYYNKMTEKSFYINNFVKVMISKFLDIFNNLNNTNYTAEDKEKSLVLIFIEERIKKLKKLLDKSPKGIFEEIYPNIYNKYFIDLRKQQSIRSKEFNTTNQIIDEAEIEKLSKMNYLISLKMNIISISFVLLLNYILII